jgi:hypothetical protein
MGCFHDTIDDDEFIMWIEWDDLEQAWCADNGHCFKCLSQFPRFRKLPRLVEQINKFNTDECKVRILVDVDRVIVTTEGYHGKHSKKYVFDFRDFR